MSVYVSCKARWEAQAPKSRDNVLLRHRQVSNKVNFFPICVSDKCHFCVRMLGRYVSCEKWVQYESWWQWGERIGQSVIMFISPVSMNGLKAASSLLKGWGRGKSHVTLIQEMNGQRAVSLYITHLWQKFWLDHCSWWRRVLCGPSWAAMFEGCCSWNFYTAYICSIKKLKKIPVTVTTATNMATLEEVVNTNLMRKTQTRGQLCKCR